MSSNTVFMVHLNHCMFFLIIVVSFLLYERDPKILLHNRY